MLLIDDGVICSHRVRDVDYLTQVDINTLKASTISLLTSLTILQMLNADSEYRKVFLGTQL